MNRTAANGEFPLTQGIEHPQLFRHGQRGELAAQSAFTLDNFLQIKAHGGSLRNCLSNLRQQKRQLLDVIAVGQAVIAEYVALVAEFLYEGGGIGHRNCQSLLAAIVSNLVSRAPTSASNELRFCALSATAGFASTNSAISALTLTSI